MLARIVDTNEGTLLLFTSGRQMRDVLDALPAHLRDITVAQDKTPRARLVARHRKRVDAGEGSLLAGLASLAEGVDLPGRYCTHVIIAKLPFAPPDSPIEATLAEWIESQGRSAFVELMVPQTSVKLQQAVGRLLRTETDSGRITLLDRRVVTRQYGRRMLDCLPPMRRVIEPVRGRAAA